MPLKVGHREGADEVSGTEGRDPVFEMLPHPCEGRFFERSVAVDFQILVAEFDEGEGSLLAC